ncbi:hypothetical protein ACUIJN_25670 [Metabacillus halosaccharovorans]|uniref:hypothetical protein n=1 Tax=Metabacillus halosaccharovorans TaxID=930124 RepID=UPI00115B0043|nr:hypothetical protein [Metabacillus halosaccharovorans]MCM3443279.1 hypothetical protein [Metabacillus halosaccharovorans]
MAYIWYNIESYNAGYGQRWLLRGRSVVIAVFVTRDELDTMIAFAALVVSIIVATRNSGNKND